MLCLRQPARINSWGCRNTRREWLMFWSRRRIKLRQLWVCSMLFSLMKLMQLGISAMICLKEWNTSRCLNRRRSQTESSSALTLNTISFQKPKTAVWTQKFNISCNASNNLKWHCRFLTKYIGRLFVYKITNCHRDIAKELLLLVSISMKSLSTGCCSKTTGWTGTSLLRFWKA